jgi:hypothetical protein
MTMTGVPLTITEIVFFCFFGLRGIEVHPPQIETFCNILLGGQGTALPVSPLTRLDPEINFLSIELPGLAIASSSDDAATGQLAVAHHLRNPGR